MGWKNIPWILVRIYTDTKTGDDEFVRIFSQDIDPIELLWHRDRRTRIVEAVEPTDWMMQLDNETPRKIEKVEIPAEAWHRVIKGTGDLKVKITEF